MWWILIGLAYLGYILFIQAWIGYHDADGSLSMNEDAIYSTRFAVCILPIGLLFLIIFYFIECNSYFEKRGTLARIKRLNKKATNYLKQE